LTASISFFLSIVFAKLLPGLGFLVFDAMLGGNAPDDDSLSDSVSDSAKFGPSLRAECLLFRIPDSRFSSLEIMLKVFIYGVQYVRLPGICGAYKKICLLEIHCGVQLPVVVKIQQFP